MGSNLGSKDRVLRILQRLVSGAAVTVKELVDEMGVSSKTVRRDLASFQKAGLVSRSTPESGGSQEWRFEPQHKQCEVNINYFEALAICLGLRFLTPLDSSPFGDAARSGEKKVRGCISPSALRLLTPLCQSWRISSPGASRYSTKRGFAEEIIFAVADRRKLVLNYRSSRSTQSNRYKIWPYSFTWHKGSLYVIAFSESHGEQRTFKLDRMEKIAGTQEEFDLPSDFDQKKVLAGAFGVYEGHGDYEVRIRFSADVARYVREGNWHESQVLTELADGGVSLTLRLSSTEEVKHWVYSFGSEAVVEQPESLRDEILQELRVMSDSYEPIKTKRLSASKRRK